MCDEGALRVTLLYNTEDERLNSQAVGGNSTAFEAKAVGNNGSGGVL
jgi:hypothetical protein